GPSMSETKPEAEAQYVAAAGHQTRAGHPTEAVPVAEATPPTAGGRAPSATVRMAGPEDARSVARLHAESWPRDYRGAYADAYLDGDVVADRLAVWSARLADPAGTVTIAAEDGSDLVGFVHVVLDDDERWGSLVDNLHVVWHRKRSGIGRALLARAAAAVVERARTRRLYLWVQEPNVAAQRFYLALGGVRVERRPLEPPGGNPAWLVGSPHCFRMTWPDAARLAA